MRFGPKCEDGFLPVFSVNTEDEARRLLVLTCSRGADGNYYAPELVHTQTLENLDAFSDRLQRGWDLMQRSRVAPQLSDPLPFESARSRKRATRTTQRRAKR